MRVVVFGATGRTGREVVRLAHRRGHEVIAAARSAASADWPADVEARAVDVRDGPAVATALADVDAAVLAVGVGRSREPTTVYSTGVDNVLSGLDAGGARRLSVVSALPAGPRDALPGTQRLASRVLERFFGATYADMRRMEATLRTNGLDWVCLRPPRLVARPPKNSYHLDARPLGGRITHADLAAALLDVLDDADQHRAFRYVAN